MPRMYQRPAPLEDVLQEYLEEGAFQYAVRQGWATHPRLSWEDLWSSEQRLDKYLHGLVLGGRKSAELLKDKLMLDEEGDPGEAFVAAATLPSLNLVEPMEWLTKAIAEGPPHSRALSDGLLYNTDPHLNGWLEDYLIHESAKVRAVGAEVLGRRRSGDLPERLKALAEDPDPIVVLAVLTGIKDRGSGPQHHKAVACLDSGKAEAVLRAVWYLLESGDQDIVSWLRKQVREANPALRRDLAPLLAVAGDLRDFDLIVDLLRKDSEGQASFLLTLGLLGHVDAIELLIGKLADPSNEAVFTATYQALRTLTGVDHFPEFDLEEVDPKQVEAYQGQWSRWWAVKRREFSANLKWRRGMPISPPVLVDDILRSGNAHRRLSCLELKVRYGCPDVVSLEERLDRQLQQMDLMKDWAKTNEGKFRSGQLYFSGQH